MTCLNLCNASFPHFVALRYKRFTVVEQLEFHQLSMHVACCCLLFMMIPLSLPPESVRLVGGANRCSGILEVKSGHLWLPVCDSWITPENALVICRDLECGFPKAHYGRIETSLRNVGPTFKCDGTEKHLMDCPTTVVNSTEEECYKTHLSCKGNT